MAVKEMNTIVLVAVFVCARAKPEEMENEGCYNLTRAWASPKVIKKKEDNLTKTATIAIITKTAAKKF